MALAKRYFFGDSLNLTSISLLFTVFFVFWSSSIPTFCSVKVLTLLYIYIRLDLFPVCKKLQRNCVTSRNNKKNPFHPVTGVHSVKSWLLNFQNSFKVELQNILLQILVSFILFQYLIFCYSWCSPDFRYTRIKNFIAFACAKNSTTFFLFNNFLFCCKCWYIE